MWHCPWFWTITVTMYAEETEWTEWWTCLQTVSCYSPSCSETEKCNTNGKWGHVGFTLKCLYFHFLTISFWTFLLKSEDTQDVFVLPWPTFPRIEPLPFWLVEALLYLLSRIHRLWATRPNTWRFLVQLCLCNLFHPARTATNHFSIAASGCVSRCAQRHTTGCICHCLVCWGLSTKYRNSVRSVLL